MAQIKGKAINKSIIQKLVERTHSESVHKCSVTACRQFDQTIKTVRTRHTELMYGTRQRSSQSRHASVHPRRVRYCDVGRSRSRKMCCTTTRGRGGGGACGSLTFRVCSSSLRGVTSPPASSSFVWNTRSRQATPPAISWRRRTRTKHPTDHIYYSNENEMKEICVLLA